MSTNKIADCPLQCAAEIKSKEDDSVDMFTGLDDLLDNLEDFWPLHQAHQELDISWPRVEAFTKAPIASTLVAPLPPSAPWYQPSWYQPSLAASPNKNETISVESSAPIVESDDPLMLTHASLTKDHSISFHPSTIFFGCY